MGLTGTALAVDAGNTKTEVALVATDGSLLGAARGGGFQPPRVGAGLAVDVLAPLVASVTEQAGLTGPVGHLSAFLANADLPSEEADLTAELAGRGWAHTVSVRNDTFALLRAGLPDDAKPLGVAVVCGAGINCAGLGHGGATARFPAVGRISGDWGGGSHLADEALWSAARAEDGRGAPTELVRALPAHFGLVTMPELIAALHLRALPGHRRHELVPVLFAVAASGDAVARTLVARQAEEVVLMATVALQRLGLLDEPAPVILGGGVLAARHPLLDDRITQLLSARAPKAVPRVVTAPPVLGAALDTLDRAGATAEAYERLRGAWGERTVGTRREAGGQQSR
ncbi:BadF/BadG/BcrA/BcrD ATPase family protein [Streptomyces sp. ISID311]|uniref:N-acetylglucosamine kinase n=1 Tax=Streptomyces sp. ISID311 TaxID=2601673 RepID=UPI0011BD2ED6|nr:BadF/BadG/BcrA/BcrD ATPase family protein [Streptomyces sp. ISID311]TXC99223.1 ATPase [Streptomyces sp. ISID311]